MNTKTIKDKLLEIPRKNVLIVGDVMLDCFVYGTVRRISPEATAFILSKTSEVYMAGGAGNVATNIASLGAKAFIHGVVGKDNASQHLLQLFKKKHINASGISVDKKRITTQKVRYAEKHHLLRVDEEMIEEIGEDIQKKMMEVIEQNLQSADVVILSDYAKGVFSKKFTQQIIRRAKKLKKIIVADVKPANMSFFPHVTVVKPNLSEAKKMTGLADLDQIGETLKQYFHANIAITLSEDGVSVFTKKGRKDIPTKKIKVTDVSGAGDTMLSVIALGLSVGLSLEEAAYIANFAGGIVVQKPGTATLSLEELLGALEKDNHVEDTYISPKLWGYEKWLENNEKYCCKLLSINKGYQCSLHYHKEKDEMFFVTKGHIRLESDGKVSHMHEGNFARILPGTKHRFRGIEDSIIIEVSTHHEESDSYRIEESRKVE